MENYKLEENLQALQGLVAQYEAVLRKVGVDVNTLPEDIKTMLDTCAETHLNTGLHDMDEIFLKEFYFQKRREQMDNKLAASKLQAKVDDLKKQIQKESLQCDILKRFVDGRVESEEETKVTISHIENQIKSLESKTHDMSVPENVDIEELMRKIAILKAREKEGKK